MKVGKFLATVLILLNHGSETTVVKALNLNLSTLIEHMPDIDQAFGNMIALEGFDDEHILMLMGQRLISAEAKFSAFLDSYSYVKILQKCDATTDLVSLSRSNVPLLIISQDYSVQRCNFTKLHLNVASRASTSI